LTLPMCGDDIAPTNLLPDSPDFPHLHYAPQVDVIGNSMSFVYWGNDQ
jgi:hypothetical protein